MDKTIINPEEWYYKNLDYLIELAYNNKLSQLQVYDKVYFVIRIAYDEIMNGGFGQFLSNSSKVVIKEIVDCAEQLKNNKLTLLFNEVSVLLKNIELPNIPQEVSIKLEELSNDFYEIDDDCDLLDLLDKYYYKHSK